MARCRSFGSLEVPFQEQSVHFKLKRLEEKRQVYGPGWDRRDLPRQELRGRLNTLSEQVEDVAIDLNDLIQTTQPCSAEQRLLLRQARGQMRTLQRLMEAAVNACTPEQVG